LFGLGSFTDILFFLLLEFDCLSLSFPTLILGGVVPDLTYFRKMVLLMLVIKLNEFLVLLGELSHHSMGFHHVFEVESRSNILTSNHFFCLVFSNLHKILSYLEQSLFTYALEDGIGLQYVNDY
jgi:hypothetical protein